MERHIQITVTDSGRRLDKLLAEELEGVSRSAAQSLIGQGLVTSAGKTLSKSAKLAAGQLVQVVLPEPKALDVLPEEIPLEIVFEDDDMLVVNKPKGMVVHPAPGNYTGTLVNALLHHCGKGLSGINGVLRPGIVHRIDKDTSGLLLVAKNDHAHRGLAGQIQAHSLTREYRAVLCGGASARLYLSAPAIGDWPHPSDPGAFGQPGPSGGRGPGIWAQKGSDRTAWPVPSCRAAWLCPPDDRRIYGVFSGAAGIFQRLSD